jgi:hypothetical protein
LSDAIDEAAESVQTTETSSSEPGAENVSNGSPAGDNQSNDLSVGTSTEAGTAEAVNLPEDGQQEPSQPVAETKANPADGQGSVSYEEQYKRVQGWATKVHQRNLELEQRLKALEESAQKQSQQSAQPQTEPWDPEDARHQDFLKLVDKADYYSELIQGEDNPEIKKLLQDKQLRLLGNEGVDLLQRWQRAVRSQERERRLNPQAFYRKLIRQEAQPVVQETLQTTSQQYQQVQQARGDVESWMSKNKDIATPENIKAILGHMQSGMPFQVASAIAERDHYRKQVSAAQKASASAEEKERLLQGNAAGVVSRNPNASKQLDVAKLLKESGARNSREKIDKLFDLDRQGLL